VKPLARQRNATGGASAPPVFESLPAMERPEDAATRNENKRFHFARHRWLAMLARDSEITGADLKVAVLIWEHTNSDYGYAWPSLDYIATQMSLDRSTVVRSMKKLVKRGWIIRRRGQFRSNHYYLAIGSKLMDESD
jgi:DNA-binding MarR family transcriptional regulator